MKIEQHLPYYRFDVIETLNKLDTETSGLSMEEVKIRKERFGLNKLEQKKQKSLFRIFIDQINNPVIYLLAGATVVSFLFSDIPEAIAIIVVIILNGIIGFWMEYQARTSMASLRALQLLFLNLLSDVFPALALGIGRGNPLIMKRKPKDPGESVLNRNNWIGIGVYGFVIAMVMVLSWFISHSLFDHSRDLSNNIAFFSLAFTQLFHVFDMREANEHTFINQVTRNKYVWFALLFCITALFAAYFIPVLHHALNFVHLAPASWFQIGITVLSSIVLIQVIKEIFNI